MSEEFFRQPLSSVVSD